MVPIGWVAVGDPATILPPERDDEIWSILGQLDFPKEVLGVDRPRDVMAGITARYSRILAERIMDRIIAT